MAYLRSPYDDGYRIQRTMWREGISGAKRRAIFPLSKLLEFPQTNKACFICFLFSISPPPVVLQFPNMPASPITATNASNLKKHEDVEAIQRQYELLCAELK